MVVLLNNLISENHSKCNLVFLNAGVPGSDPYFQERIMDSIFIPDGFKNFVFVMNISDLYDHIFRGGRERFLQNGKLEFSTSPINDYLYRFSFLYRSYIHGVLKADYSLLPPQKLNIKKENTVDEYFSLFKEISEKLEEINGKLIIVAHPYPLNYDITFSENWSVSNYSYFKNLHNKLANEQIHCFDLEPHFNKTLNPENYLSYSWKIDGHFNSKGYDLFAKILYNELKINNILLEYCP